MCKVEGPASVDSWCGALVRRGGVQCYESLCGYMQYKLQVREG